MTEQHTDHLDELLRAPKRYRNRTLNVDAETYVIISAVARFLGTSRPRVLYRFVQWAYEEFKKRKPDYDEQKMFDIVGPDGVEHKNKEQGNE